MNKKLTSSITLAILGLAFSSVSMAWLEKGGERDAALALTPDLKNGVDVYEVCAACHLTEGWGTPDGTFPQLAGQLKGCIDQATGRYSRRQPRQPDHVSVCTAGVDW